ncbi:pentapeptide repeat-containing protein [Terasakiella pusilla]|uniref:pentapeptide repeat-containing protein n=1 Tax=Terasakiella pusilla TaxID=64973 RepID=UPI00068D191F|nr:pentapeptide repeat-containing protein [Terasakiella pusilla]
MDKIINATTFDHAMSDAFEQLLEEHQDQTLIFKDCTFEGMVCRDVEAGTVRFENGIFRETELKGCQLDNSHWYKCKAHGLDMSYSSVMDATFEGCDLSSSAWVGAQLTQTQFMHCKLLGASFLKSKALDLTFSHCILAMANLQGISFRKQHVCGLDFSDADLGGCDFTESVFEDCRLRNANIRGAKFSGADLRSCDLGGLELKDASLLKGAIISKNQASDLLQAYGLQVL